MSEVLGFVLAFSLVVSAVGIVYVVGFGGLQETRDGERVNNAERAFDVLADNMVDVYADGAPSRATEIKLADARLTHADPIYVNTTVGSSGSTVAFSNSSAIAPISYDAGTGARIVYSNGAVVRDQRAGERMLVEPAFVFSRDRTVLFYVRTMPRGPAGVGGSRTTLVRAERTRLYSPLSNATGPYDVTLEVTTPRAEAWERYLESELAWEADPCATAGGTVRCEFETEEVHLTVVEIHVEFS
ncbi:DUF7289 family protein [Halegenticoccus soli]|uniref:DUF7289 family protein n=1 Tax=Halegenticoccus soli TaxID=1985678 RepID=UPI001179B1DA|nr:hypothetical protein [Halegenticoccus soli]